MAETKFGFQIGSSLATQYLTDSKYIRAGYMVVQTIAERNALPVDSGSGGVITKGSLVYVANDSTPSNNGTYRYNGTSWVKENDVNTAVPANAVFTDTTYTFTNGTNGFTVTPSGGQAQTVTITPSITDNITGFGNSGYLTKFNGTHTITNGPQLISSINTQDQTTKFLRQDGTWAAPSYTAGPMLFIGSLGTGGTATTLPAAAAANKGHTYKVITAGTYQSVAAKVGDLLISNGSSWVLIPSGDEPAGTVTNIATGSGLTGGPITDSGTISHADTSTQASITANGRKYITGVTLDDFGHVTGLTTGTETVVDTDSYINNASFANDDTNNNVKMTLTRTGTVTGTVTANIPKVSSSSAGVAPKGAAVSSQSQTTKFLREDGTWAAPSYTTNTNTATAADNILDGSNSGTQITYAPYSSQQSKLSFDTSTTAPIRTDRLNLNGYFYATKLYSGGAEVSVNGHTHATALATDAGTSSITLAHGGKYKLTAGGTSVIFTMPTDNNTDTKVTQTVATDDTEYAVLTKAVTAVTTVTDTSKFSANVTINPSKKSVTATTYKVTTNASITYNSTNGCLEIIV